MLINIKSIKMEFKEIQPQILAVSEEYLQAECFDAGRCPPGNLSVFDAGRCPPGNLSVFDGFK